MKTTLVMTINHSLESSYIICGFTCLMVMWDIKVTKVVFWIFLFYPALINFSLLIISRTGRRIYYDKNVRYTLLSISFRRHINFLFYGYGSVHRWSILIIAQRDATQSNLFIILQVFRVSTTPIIRSTQNCNYSLRYWSSYLPPTWPS